MLVVKIRYQFFADSLPPIEKNIRTEEIGQENTNQKPRFANGFLIYHSFKVIDGIAGGYCIVDDKQPALIIMDGTGQKELCSWNENTATTKIIENTIEQQEEQEVKESN